jgi:hypothetical protein
LEYKGDRVNKETMAVAINLTTVHQITGIVCQNNGLKLIMKRAVKTRDPLMFKMLRNISQHNDLDIKLGFLDYVDDLMTLLLKSQETPDLLVEILAIVANLTIPEFDFKQLAASYGLIDFLTNWIYQTLNLRDSNGKSNGIVENDDIVLQCVILLGTMSLDENIPMVIAESQLLPLMVETLMIKEDDDEIVLQVCYCIYLYLCHEHTCMKLIGIPRIILLTRSCGLFD